VAKNDRTVQPELQRFLANRMGATTTEVDGSHVPTTPASYSTRSAKPQPPFKSLIHRE
jgi:hypothetical protein